MVQQARANWAGRAKLGISSNLKNSQVEGEGVTEPMVQGLCVSELSVAVTNY